jgi:hypothetical protein
MTRLTSDGSQVVEVFSVIAPALIMMRVVSLNKDKVNAPAGAVGATPLAPAPTADATPAAPPVGFTIADGKIQDTP